MISYSLYKVLHLVGVFMILLSLGTLLIVGAVRDEEARRWKRMAAAVNGLGLLVVVVAGFGLIARLHLGWPWPGWVLVKMLIWLSLGILMGLAGRGRELGRYLWWAALVLAAGAAFLAVMKPF